MAQQPEPPDPRVPPPPAAFGGPAAKGQQVPWNWLDAVVVFLLVAAGTVLAAGVLTGLAEFEVVSPQFVDVAFLALTFLLLTSLSLLWIRIRFPGAVGRLRGRRPQTGDVLAAVGFGVGAYLALNVGVGLVVQVLADLMEADLPTVQPELRRFAEDPGLAPYFAVSAVVLAPVAEELFFRGLLFQALRKHLGVWPGILASALVFALAHLSDAPAEANLLVVLPIFPLGVLLAWLMHTRGTLVVPIIVHAVFNAIGVALLITVA